MELYYDREKPITADLSYLSRRLMARSDEEITALKTVLDEFFYLDGDVYRHDRCDEEIEVYQSNMSAKSRAGKASAEARREKKDSEKEQIPTPAQHPFNTCSTDEQLTSNQEPVTINQELLTTSPGSLDEPVQPAKKRPAKNNVIKINQPDLPGLPTTGYQLKGEEFHIDQDLYSELNKIYPFVSLTAEIPKMRAWLLANSRKRKTLGGMPRFINNWLTNNSNENEAYDGGI